MMESFGGRVTVAGCSKDQPPSYNKSLLRMVFHGKHTTTKVGRAKPNQTPVTENIAVGVLDLDAMGSQHV